MVVDSPISIADSLKVNARKSLPDAIVPKFDSASSSPISRKKMLLENSPSALFLPSNFLLEMGRFLLVAIRIFEGCVSIISPLEMFFAAQDFIKTKLGVFNGFGKYDFKNLSGKLNYAFRQIFRRNFGERGFFLEKSFNLLFFIYENQKVKR